MQRKKSSTPTRIYTYGLLPPDEDTLLLVERELRLAHTFKNKLVEVERRRREGYRDVLRNLSPGLSDLEKRLREIEVEGSKLLRLRRSNTSSAETKEAASVTVSRLTEERRMLSTQLKAAKKVAEKDPLCAGMVEEVNLRAKLEAKEAYNGSPLYWGTKLLVSKDVEAVRKKKGDDPRFRRYEGEGRFGVQIQNGCSTARFHSLSHTLLQIDPVDPAVWGQRLRQAGDASATGTRGERRRGSRTTCRVRVGSSETGKPLWATFQMVFDRPFPKDAVAKWAWISRRRVGTKNRYCLQVVVESETFRAASSRPGLVAAVNINWRRRPEAGLRVCYVVGEDGEHHEVLMNERTQRRLEHADSLRSIRDHNFNQVLEQLKSLIGDADLPEWLVERLSGREGRLSFTAWRSQARLASVALAWRVNRFLGDDRLFDLVESWRKQDKHLCEWECCEREGALLSRQEHYRLEARKICQKYSVVVVPEVDLGKLAKKSESEDLPPNSRKNKHQSAPASFLDALKLCAPKLGTTLVWVGSKHVTADCSACGSRQEWDRRVLRHRCDDCGAEWDQDANACLNALRRHASDPAPNRSQEPLADVRKD